MPSLFPVLVFASFLVVGRASSFRARPKLTVKLNNGMDFPSVSFGLQIYDEDTAEKYTTMALKAGIRNFFASILTGNQKGFARAVAKSSVPRKDIFICGSVNTGGCSGGPSCKTKTLAGCEENLKNLSEKKLDMIMLDYPARDCRGIQGQWEAFEEFWRAGKTRSIAVSNFSPTQLDCLLLGAKVKPAVNQLSYNVLEHKDDPIQYNRQRGGILVQAYSPLGAGMLLNNAVLKRLSKTHKKSTAQVALRWILQRGATFTTSASSLAHFKEDLDLFDWTLSAGEMQLLNEAGRPIVVVHG